MKNTINKEELDLYLRKLDVALKNDIEDIKNFDRSDILHLEKDMLLNLRNLKKYDAKTLKIAKRLEAMYKKEEILGRQVGYTREGIIENLEYDIKKSIAVIIVYAMISSNNFQEFLKKTIILLILDAITLHVNIDYFTSDGRKLMVEKRLSRLRDNITSEQINYDLYRGINRCFTLKLDTQYDKLLELYPEIDDEKVKVRKKK